jgi:TetR/AcrR family transcriptional regulator, mexJK operon transcriptional repressor
MKSVAEQRTRRPAVSGRVQEPRGRRGRPNRDESEKLRNELLRHALDQFLEKGFEGTTIQSITEALGMSKRTAFVWYGNKTALFQAAMQSALDALLDPLDGLSALETDDIEQTLIDVARLITRTLLSSEGQRLIRVANAEAYKLPEIGPEFYRRGHERLVRFLSDLFARRIFQNDLDPVEFEDQASAFLSLLSEPARMRVWGFERESFDVETFIHGRVRLFLGGVAATYQPTRTHS